MTKRCALLLDVDGTLVNSNCQAEQVALGK